MASLDQQIADVGAKIDAVENNIADVEVQIANAGSEKEKEELREEQKQLREEEKQLREMELLLLRQQERQQQAALVAPPAVYPDDFGDPGEGIFGRQKTYMTRRLPLLHTIFTLLGSLGFMLVKAPPQSGKTSILQLFAEFVRAKGGNVVYINASRYKKTFDDAFAHKAGGSLQKLMDDGAQLTVVVDEAQTIYNETESRSTTFWEQLKDLSQGQKGATRPHHVRVLLAAAYGTRRSSAIREQGSSSPCLSTPINIDSPHKVVGILPTCDGSASLRLSDEEYEELWLSFVAFTRKGWDFTLRSYVESITGRQVALVAYCMDYLRAEATNEMLDPAVLNRNAIFKLTGPPFMDSLQLVRSLKYSRDFLMQGKTAEVIRMLLWADQLPLSMFNSDKELEAAVQKLNKFGHAVIDAQDRWVTFPSPLHRAYSARLLYTSSVNAHKLEPGDATLEKLLPLILQRINPTVLRESMSVGANGRLYEACWHFEVYRATSALMRAVVSPEAGWAIGIRGHLDVYVADLKLALELTRDGDQLAEHLERFAEGGKYWPMISSGAVEQWAVRDFVSPGQKPSKETNPGLYTIQGHADWAKADILHQGVALTTVMMADTAEDMESAALMMWLTRATAAAQQLGPPPLSSGN